STVRSPGWRTHPANPDPSYSSVSLVTIPQRAAATAASDQLDEDHLGRVTLARAELQDSRVPTGTIDVPRSEVLEQLVHGELVLRERRERLAARVQVTALGERDQFLDLRLDCLGLRLRRLDPLVLDDLLAQVHEQRLAMRAVAAELVFGLLMSHRRWGLGLPARVW